MQSSDLNDLKQLVAELRAEHVAQKEKEARERWTKYVSLTMVIIAVLASIATLKGGGFSSLTLKEMNEATSNQAQASDQWSYYEATSIKQNLYEIERDCLMPGGNAGSAAWTNIQAKLQKYDKNKADITSEAKKFESVRDAARQRAADAAKHSRQMGLANTLYQISIALGATCLIVKKKPLWFASSILALLATAQMFYVLFLL